MVREQLQLLLEAAAGGNKVYFQPPANVTMEYPCIVYERDASDTRYADNAPYTMRFRYQIKVIDSNADSPMLGTVASLPLCLYDRHFTAGNLHHDVFNIYF
jgi:hypothetical protein